MSISSTLIDRADIRFQEAAAGLRRHVGCFWVIAAERGAALHLVPDGTAAIMIQLRDGEPGEWSLRGPLLEPYDRRFASRTTLVGVRLRPGVAFLLSRIPGHRMLNRRVTLARRPAFRELVSADPPPLTPERCIDALQGFLIDRLDRANVHEVVAAALRVIESERGRVTVADIAARTGVSPRHLNRLMRTWIGYGPKRHASIARFQTTLERMERSPRQSAALLASEAGYFDQAHLTVDVARFAGATPGRLTSNGVSDFSKTRCDDLP